MPRQKQKSLTSKQRSLLKQVYFKDKVFFGRDKLYAYIRQYYPDSGISRRQVMAWLKEQNVAQLFKQPKKTTNIASTILSKPFDQIGIDLADMQSYEHKGFNYILTAIDLFSKYAWARPIKGKSGSTVARAMKDILKQIGRPVRSIRSDNGSEFVSAPFKRLMQTQDIKQVFSNAAAPQSNGQVERFNGIIKRMIKMNITQTDSPNWPKDLPQLVRNYNNVPSRVTKKVPSDLLFDRTEATRDKVKQNITKAVSKANQSRQSEAKFKVGDKVRLKLVVPSMYKQHELWTRDVFTVSKVFKPRKAFTAASYFVTDDDGTEYRDRLYNNDLQIVTKVRNRVRAPKKYVISKILRHEERDGRQRYLVKWLGYNEPSWEPEATLKRDVPKLLKRYHQRLGV